MTSPIERSAPLDLWLIKCLFLLAGLTLNICTTFRRAFMTSYFGLSNAQFSLFMSISYPVSFGAGLAWTLAHKRSDSQFNTIKYASVGALACFLSTFVVPSEAKLLLCLLMLGYVGFCSAIIPIICILCFQTLKDRTYFGQNFVFSVAGSLLMTQVVQFTCRVSSKGISRWFFIYPLSAAVHALFLIGVGFVERKHRGEGGKIYISTTNNDTESLGGGKDSGEFEEQNDLESNPSSVQQDQPVCFDNSPYASNLSGSSFAFTKRSNPFSLVGSGSQRPKTEFSTPRQSLLHNKRFLAVVGCGFLVSLSSNLMKILLPSYLEDYVHVNPLVESFIHTGSSIAEFLIMITFPWISRQLSFQSCFLSAVSLYFLYMTCFSMLPTSVLLKSSSGSVATGQRIVLMFILCAPLKGIASGLMNSSSSLLVSCITGKNSGAQKVYSAIVSMFAGFIAGLYGFWLALETDSLAVETSLVFRHCFLWCFVALMFSFYVFLLEKPGSACRNQNYRYEALLLDQAATE